MNIELGRDAHDWLLEACKVSSSLGGQPSWFAQDVLALKISHPRKPAVLGNQTIGHLGPHAQLAESFPSFPRGSGMVPERR